MFYYTGDWSPGGNEALGPEPSWPQMSVWVAVYEILTGQPAAALSRLQWCASVFGRGYMPPGEAVSNVSLQPCISSMCEPLTASAFILAALIYEGQYALSVIPPVYNAGARKTISVNSGTGDDWGQWVNVPYFIGPQTTSATSQTTQIKRTYITNDEVNFYLRLDNFAGTFPKYQDQPLFALRIYSQNLLNPSSPSTNLGIEGAPIRRPMSYMLERRSDSDLYQHWGVSAGEWVADWAVNWVIAPQWDPSTGRLEAVIPITCLASESPHFGDSWADLIIVLASYNSDTRSWQEGDSMLLHYRLTTEDQAWIYGNIER